MDRQDIRYIQEKGIHIDAPTTTYHLVFKHLRGWYMADNTEPYLTGGGEYTREGVEILLSSTAEPLPCTMYEGHRLASAAYVVSESGLLDVGLTVLNAHPNGSVMRNALRRSAMTAAIEGLPPVDRAYFHIYMSFSEGKDLTPILRKALATRLSDDSEVLRLHLLGKGRPSSHNPGGICTARGGIYRVFLEDRFRYHQ